MRVQNGNGLNTQFVTAPRLKRIFVAIALAFSLADLAFALPVGEQIISGQIQLGRSNPQNLVVKQGSAKAIVNWQGFSIAPGEAVQFQQPDAGSVILNRVTGSSPSEIFGRLSANGQVFLVNPAGVLFGSTATVDVGSLVASTLRIRDDDFLAGRHVFSADGPTGNVNNQGVLNAADRGTIALLGAQVNNGGTISAKLGTVGLAAGGKISLDFNGDGLTKIVVDAEMVNALVANGGMVIADGGLAVLSARAAGVLTETVLNQQGIVRAGALVERNGKIVLDGGVSGVTLVSGTLDAAGFQAGQRGGEINVLGHNVGLVGQAHIDARGGAGGGTVLVGGDYQGKNSHVRNAAATFVGPDTLIRADAVNRGNGGKVVVWSDDATRAYGTISAKGGAQGGDGGLVETSGKFLDVLGVRVNASAPNGKSGEWLLDPNNINITDTCDPCADSNISGNPNFTSFNDDAILTPDAIKDALNLGTKVTVTTGNGGSQLGNITVNADINKTTGPDATLTLNAHNDIIVHAGNHITSTAGKLNVNFNADSDGVGGGAIVMNPGSSIDTNGGDVRFYGRTNPSGGSATGNTSNIDGIKLDGARIDTRVLVAVVVAESGSIFMRGSSWESTNSDSPVGSGILVKDSSILAATGDLIGTGGAGRSGGSGGMGVSVNLGNDSGNFTTSGKLSIIGTGGNGGVNGIYGGGVDISMGGNDMFAGDLSIIGTGGGAGNGVSIAMTGSTMSATKGKLSITGTGGGSGDGVHVSMTDGNVFATTGDLSIIGTGSGSGKGVSISMTGSSMYTTTGGLSITGTGGGSGDGVGISMTDSGMFADHLSITGTGGGSGGGGVAISMTDSVTASNGVLSISGEGGTPGVNKVGVSLTGSGMYMAGNLGPVDQLDQTSNGVELDSVILKVTAGSAIDIRGRAETAGSIGVKLLNSTIATNDGPGRIVISGESTGSGPGLYLEGATIGGPGSTGDIVFRAKNAGGGPMVSFGDGSSSAPSNSVQTNGGTINIRPGGVDASGALTDALDVPIDIGGQNNGFKISLSDMGIGKSGFSNVVIGSNSHAGAINFYGADLPFAGNLTLQNDGVESSGISLHVPLSATGVVTLTSGGPVTQAENAPITAASLLLHGSQPKSNFQLTNANNSVVQFAAQFDTAKENNNYGNVNFINSGALAIARISGTGFNAGTNQSTSINAANTVVAGDLLVNATGNLTLNQNVTTLGSDITLVAGGTFINNIGEHAVTAVTGRWLIYSNAPDGDIFGGLASGNLPLWNRTYASGGPNLVAESGDRYLFRQVPSLTVTADNKQKIYGDTVALTASIGGLVDAGKYGNVFTQEQISGLPSIISAGTDVSAPVSGSPYGISLGQTASVAPSGYGKTILINGQLVVEKAHLTVTADNKTRIYGDANPTKLTETITGYVNNENASTAGVTGTAALNTSATSTTNVGRATITAGVGTLDAANYDFSKLVDGTLTIGKAALTIAADNKSKVYGPDEPILTATFTGFKLSDTATVVSGLTLVAPTGAAATAGNHVIAAANATATNYDINYLPGTLTVDRAVLTYVAEPATRMQGNPNPPLHGKASGFVLGETQDKATAGTLNFSSPASSISGPGKYAVNGSGLSAANYFFAQLATNATALTVVPTTMAVTPSILKDVTFESSNVYAKNFGSPHLCVGTGPLSSDSASSAKNDLLSLEWSRVRQSPNLSNCIGLGQRNSCQDF